MQEQLEETQEETQEETTETKEAPRPEGLPEDQEWDHVEMDEKTQRRFNRIYASMKQSEGAMKQMAEDHRKMVEKIHTLEGQLTSKEREDRKTVLMEQKAAAMDEGDNKRVVDIDEQLATLRQPVQAEPQPELPPDPGWFTPARQDALIKWASETTDQGEAKRPWAQEGHPKNARAVEITNAVINDPEFAGAEISEILGEVDRLMAPRRTAPSAPAVMSGNSSARPKEKSTPKLTQDQLAIAKVMGVSPKDYAKALEE